MPLFFSTFLILALLVSTYGWGWMVARISYHTHDQHWAFLSALGLSCLIFLGGILNALSIAYAGGLYVLFGIGIVFSFVALFRRRAVKPIHQYEASSRGSADLIFSSLSYILILGTAAFLIVTLMPTNILNYHDDFYVHTIGPYRMMQTGTLGGNPFSRLGFDSFGAQSFLQAFILAIFPTEYVNGFDSVFCFILAAFLLIGIAKTLKAHGLYLLLSLSVLIIINPQTVNISAVYSGSVMILGMIFSSSLLENSRSCSGIKSMVASVLPFALFVSALISLKMSFVFFAVIYSSIYFLILLYFSIDKKNSTITMAFIIVLILIFLLPWITVYWENYLYVLQHGFSVNPMEFSESNWFLFQKIMIRQFLHSDKLLYGGHYFSYVLVMITLLMASILSICCVKRNESIAFRPYLISVFASGVACIASYFLNTYIRLDSEATLRYSCPVLIGTLPYAVLIFGSHLGTFQLDIRGNKPYPKIKKKIGMTFVLIVLQIILIGLFWDNLRDRIRLAYYDRTNLSFLLARVDNSDLYQYNQYALSNEARDLMRSIQSKTEKGQAIFTSIEIPCHLDFTRNKIYTFDDFGIYNPRLWLNISFTNNPEDIRRYLKNMGIRYIMWEYNSSLMRSEEKWRSRLNSIASWRRKEALYNLYFRKMMFALAEKSKIIYNSNEIILIDLE